MNKILKSQKGIIKRYLKNENGDCKEIGSIKLISKFDRKGRMIYLCSYTMDEPSIERKVIHIGPISIHFEREFAEGYRISDIFLYSRNDKVELHLGGLNVKNGKEIEINKSKRNNIIRSVRRSKGSIIRSTSKFTNLHGVDWLTSFYEKINDGDYYTYIRSEFSFGNNNRCFEEAKDMIGKKIYYRAEYDYKKDLLLWKEYPKEVLKKYQYDSYGNKVEVVEEYYMTGLISKHKYVNTYWED